MRPWLNEKMRKKFDITSSDNYVAKYLNGNKQNLYVSLGGDLEEEEDRTELLQKLEAKFNEIKAIYQ